MLKVEEGFTLSYLSRLACISKRGNFSDLTVSPRLLWDEERPRLDFTRLKTPAYHSASISITCHDRAT